LLNDAQGPFAGMFTGKERNKSKIEEIRLSPELLRINSNYAGGEGLIKILLILIVSLLIVFYKDIIHIIKDKAPDEQLVLVSMVVLCFAALVFTLYKMNQNSGKTLIITEKGFFIESGLAELWKDFDEYRWNSSTDLKRDLFSGQKEGPSLILYNNRGAWPKVVDLMRYAMSFTHDQVQQMDNIFNRLGIRKIESV
jgi:hypothetical protein